MSVFGEIQLGYSRAVSDDEDDDFSTVDQDESLKRKIYWINENKPDSKITADKLIVADGNNSSAFVYTYLISHFNDTSIEVLGLNSTLSEYKVFKQNYENKDLKNFQDFQASLRSNYIYLINFTNGQKLIVCQLYDRLKSNELYDWIKQLTDRIEFTNALMFCSQYKSRYLGSELQTPFVRYVSSNKAEDTDSLCTRLEEPNFIGDLSAAVANYCISKKIEFTTFVCYTSSLMTDSQSVKQMFDAAKVKLKEGNFFINDASSQSTLLKVGNIVSSVSALYM